MNELDVFDDPDVGGGQNRKPRVAVVFGGRSSEHGVSTVTAGGVLRAIDRSKYDVVPVGIARDGRWVLEADDPARLQIEGREMPEVNEKGQSLVLASDAAGPELIVLDQSQVPGALGEVDVVLPLLHGPYGEDGTLQGLLEMAGVRYVGAGVTASAMSMDKHYANVIFQSEGLPVTPYAVVRPGEWQRDRVAVEETVHSLGYPVFVKPCRGGSSIGISKVSRPQDLPAAMELAIEHDPKVIIEASAEGVREIECGVLGALDGGRPDASVVAEIIPDESVEFYDFATKYIDEEHVQLQVPADLPETVAARIREMAITAFQAVSCEGLARVDFFLTPDGSVLINEINTMPGFTETSMFPRVWAASGLDYPALVDRLLKLALSRPTGLR